MQPTSATRHASAVPKHHRSYSSIPFHFYNLTSEQPPTYFSTNPTEQVYTLPKRLKPVLRSNTSVQPAVHDDRSIFCIQLPPHADVFDYVRVHHVRHLGVIRPGLRTGHGKVNQLRNFERRFSDTSCGMLVYNEQIDKVHSFDIVACFFR